MNRSKSGFTIVELLIVIVVIAIIAAISIVAYNGIQQRARTAQLQSAANQAGKKIAVLAANGSYPGAVSPSDVSLPSGFELDYRKIGEQYCATISNSAGSYYTSSVDTGGVGPCSSAYYPLDGNMSDASAFQASGVAYGAVAGTGRNGSTSGALSFNGTSSYVTAPFQNFVSKTSNYSVSLWFKTNGTSAQALWQNSPNCSDRNAIKVSSSHVSFGYYDGSGYVRASSAIAAGEWNHVVGINSGGEVSIYVNGEKGNGTIYSYIHCVSDFAYIGKTSYGTGTDYFNGQIDDIRVYDTSLTETEALQLYNAR